MPDEYQELAELHDLFMPDVWDALVPTLEATFAHLGPDAVVVDLGAGSGVGTVRLGRITRAQVLAIEPALTMRSILLARMADDDDLAARVSIVAGAAPAVLEQIQGPIDGFVCAHMLGHLSATDRRATFSRLAGLLSDEGTGLLTLPREETPGEAFQPVEEERRIGRHRYVARHWVPEGSDSAVSEYRVLDGEHTVRSLRFSSSWSLPSRAELVDELRETGLELAREDGRLGLVRRASQS
ncbi:class I SAM-dependent methyltransferase [Salana multivorans]